MKVLAISGFKGSGKDTSADYLVKSYNFKKYSFAETLKDLVSNTYGIPRHSLDDQLLKEQPLLQFPVINSDKFSEQIHNILRGEFASVKGALYWTPRALAILEGSIKRSVSSDYWVRTVIGKIKADLDRGQNNFVISDLRFNSEINQLKEEFKFDLITIRVDRFDSTTSTDPSEVDLIGTQHTARLANKSSISDLHTRLDYLVKFYAFT